MMATPDSEPDEIEALLPWYEKGLLPPRDARRVQDYLERNPDRLRFLGLIREEMSETIEANERAGMPSPSALDRLMQAVETEARPSRAMRADAGPGFFARLLGLDRSAWLPVAGFAAALLILVQAAALGVLLWQGSEGSRLASGDPAVTIDAGNTVLVRFAETATAADISGLLRSFNAVIVDGPKPGGIYRLRISPQPLQPERREEILRQIRARSDIIAFAAPSG